MPQTIPLTRAEMNEATALQPSHLYHITDEARIALAVTQSSYQAFAKEGEASSPPQSISELTWYDPFGHGVAAEGFTILPLMAGKKRIWVDPEGGNDESDGSSHATALATLEKAKARLMPSDQLMLADRGIHIDLGYASSVDSLNSRTGTRLWPTVIRSYDHMDPSNENKWGRTKAIVRQPSDSSLRTTNDNGSNGLAFVGLHFTVSDAVYEQGGMRQEFIGFVANLLFENCRYDRVTLSLDADSSPTANVTTKRNGGSNVALKMLGLSGAWAANGRGSGLYLSGLNTVRLQNILIWHGGWKLEATRTTPVANGGPSPQAHGAYIQNSCDDVVCDQSVAMDCSYNGFGGRGSVDFRYCVSIRNPRPFRMGGGNFYAVHHPEGTTNRSVQNLLLGAASIRDDMPSYGVKGFEVSGTASGSYLRGNLLLDGIVEVLPNHYDESLIDVFTVGSAGHEINTVVEIGDNFAHDWPHGTNSNQTVSPNDGAGINITNNGERVCLVTFTGTNKSKWAVPGRLESNEADIAALPSAPGEAELIAETGALSAEQLFYTMVRNPTFNWAGKIRKFFFDAYRRPNDRAGVSAQWPAMLSQPVEVFADAFTGPDDQLVSTRSGWESAGSQALADGHIVRNNRGLCNVNVPALEHFQNAGFPVHDTASQAHFVEVVPGSNDEVRLIFGWADMNNFAYVVITPGFALLREVRGGVDRARAAPTIGSVIAGKTYRVEYSKATEIPILFEDGIEIYRYPFPGTGNEPSGFICSGTKVAVSGCSYQPQFFEQFKAGAQP